MPNARRRRPGSPSSGTAVPADLGRTISGTDSSLDGQTIGGIDQSNQDYNQFYHRLDNVFKAAVPTIASMGFLPGGAFNQAGAAAMNASAQAGAAAETAGGAGQIPLVSGAGRAAAGLPSSLADTTITGSQIPAGGGGGGGWLSKLFGGGGKKGMFDPTTLLLGGLSMFGDDPEYFQRRQGFNNPQQGIDDVMNAIRSVSKSISEQGPVTLKNSIVPAGPAPISIDGIPFQIGGGLGTDPALSDPSVLQGKPPMADPFAKSGGGQVSSSNTGTAQRRRQ
jgi:hypothetical protein